MAEFSGVNKVLSPKGPLASQGPSPPPPSPNQVRVRERKDPVEERVDEGLTRAS
jgi:hypothetical protein